MFIDPTLCQSQQRCFNLYPDVFEEGPDGKGKTRGDIELVPEEMEMDLQSAMNACPTGAISIEYD